MSAGKQPDDPQNFKQTTSAASKNQPPSALRARRTRLSSPGIQIQSASVEHPGSTADTSQQATSDSRSVEANEARAATSTASEQSANQTSAESSAGGQRLGRSRRLRPLAGEQNQEQEPAKSPIVETRTAAYQANAQVDLLSAPASPIAKKPVVPDPVTPLPFGDMWSTPTAQKSNPVTPLPVPAPWLSNLTSSPTGAMPPVQSQDKKGNTPASGIFSRKKKAAESAAVTDKPALDNNKTTRLPETNSSATMRLPEANNPTVRLPESNTALIPMPANDAGTTSSIKLPSPMKVVQMPVAGRPGHFVTGFLPILPEVKPVEKKPSRIERASNYLEKRYKSHYEGLSWKWKAVEVTTSFVIVFVVIFSLVFWLYRSVGVTDTGSQVKDNITPLTRADMQATMTAQAIQKSTLLVDPLSQNIHNWAVSRGSGPHTFVFKDGAYHILNNDDTQGASAILPDAPADLFKRPFGYSLTMDEIKGDDTSANNTFGLIIRFTQQQVSGKTATKFYSFEVVNASGGEYQFWEYDDSDSSGNGPWKSLWKHNFGKEFHQGQGAKHQNTFKIISNRKNFTLLVNGKQVGTVTDGAISTGSVGMLVNLKGTEIAFSNLKLTTN